MVELIEVTDPVMPQETAFVPACLSERWSGGTARLSRQREARSSRGSSPRLQMRPRGCRSGSPLRMAKPGSTDLEAPVQGVRPTPPPNGAAPASLISALDGSDAAPVICGMHWLRRFSRSIDDSRKWPNAAAYRYEMMVLIGSTGSTPTSLQGQVERPGLVGFPPRLERM